MMNLTYYDAVSSKTRLKRRYRWALWAFAAGVLSGSLLFHLL